MKEKTFQPDRVFSYFKAEWKVLLVVTVFGLIYNVGLLARPWFEGRMAGYLVKVLNGTGTFSGMRLLRPLRPCRFPDISRGSMSGVLRTM